MEAKVERNRDIYEKRLKGATYAEIGAEYGIGPNSARTIFEKEKRNEERKSNPIYVRLRTLTDNEEHISRIWTILSRHNLDIKEELIKVERKYLLKRVRNCGEVLADIIMRLAELLKEEDM